MCHTASAKPNSFILYSLTSRSQKDWNREQGHPEPDIFVGVILGMYLYRNMPAQKNAHRSFLTLWQQYKTHIANSEMNLSHPPKKVVSNYIFSLVLCGP